VVLPAPQQTQKIFHKLNLRKQLLKKCESIDTPHPVGPIIAIIDPGRMAPERLLRITFVVRFKFFLISIEYVISLKLISMAFDGFTLKFLKSEWSISNAGGASDGKGNSAIFFLGFSFVTTCIYGQHNLSAPSK
jgi:hypothetical protein